MEEDHLKFQTETLVLKLRLPFIPAPVVCSIRNLKNGSTEIKGSICYFSTLYANFRKKIFKQICMRV